MKNVLNDQKYHEIEITRRSVEVMKKENFFPTGKKVSLKKIFLNIFLKQILMYKNFPYEGT